MLGLSQKFGVNPPAGLSSAPTISTTSQSGVDPFAGTVSAIISSTTQAPQSVLAIFFMISISNLIDVHILEP